MLKVLLIWNIALTIFLASSIWGLIDLEKRTCEAINKQNSMILLMAQALDEAGIEVPSLPIFTN